MKNNKSRKVRQHGDGRQRINRVNDEIVKAASDIIRFEMSDPRIGAVVSVTDAKTTTDLKYCKISVSVLENGTATPEAVIEVLVGASGFIRKRIAETVNLRHTPELTFVLDDRIAHSMYMHKLLDEVVKK